MSCIVAISIDPTKIAAREKDLEIENITDDIVGIPI